MEKKYVFMIGQGQDNSSVKWMLSFTPGHIILITPYNSDMNLTLEYDKTEPLIYSEWYQDTNYICGMFQTYDFTLTISVQNHNGFKTGLLELKTKISFLSSKRKNCESSVPTPYFLLDCSKRFFLSVAFILIVSF